MNLKKSNIDFHKLDLCDSLELYKDNSNLNIYDSNKKINIGLKYLLITFLKNNLTPSLRLKGGKQII